MIVSIRSRSSLAEMGEYFGASLAAADLDQDGADDLLVGSPLSSMLQVRSLYHWFRAQTRLPQNIERCLNPLPPPPPPYPLLDTRISFVRTPFVTLRGPTLYSETG